MSHCSQLIKTFFCVFQNNCRPLVGIKVYTTSPQCYFSSVLKNNESIGVSKHQEKYQ